MRQIIATLTILLLSLATSMNCSAQASKAITQGLKAATGSAAVQIVRGINSSPNVPKQDSYPYYNGKYMGAARQVPGGVPPIETLKHKEQQKRQDDLSVNILKILATPSPEELAKKLELKKIKALKKSYNKGCSYMDKGIPSKNPLFWPKTLNNAANLGLDSIAFDCLKRYISLNPSLTSIEYAADSCMKGKAIPYAIVMINAYQRSYFQKYWANPDSSTITLADYETLARLAKKYDQCIFHSYLTHAMICYLKNDYTSASQNLMYASNSEIEASRIGFTPEWQKILFDITANLLFISERYDDLLKYAEKNEKLLTSRNNTELLDIFLQKNPYTLFLLYEAGLFTSNPDKATKYGNMCIAADKKYFDEQFDVLFHNVYEDFLTNPNTIENLDFIVNENLSKDDAINNCEILINDLVDRLPEGLDCLDDGMLHYYDESLSSYRDAILEVAKRLNTLYDNQLTPDNAVFQLLAETVRSCFTSSTKQGFDNLKSLYEQLFPKRNETEYQTAYILSASQYSTLLSFEQPKEAVKIVDKMLPILKDYSALENRIFNDTSIADTYRYAAFVYTKAGKSKKAKKMQELAK